MMLGNVFYPCKSVEWNPLRRNPVMFRKLPIQNVTFARKSDEGPALIGLDELLEDPNAGAWENWWCQVSDPFRKWFGTDVTPDTAQALAAK